MFGEEYPCGSVRNIEILRYNKGLYYLSICIFFSFAHQAKLFLSMGCITNGICCTNIFHYSYFLMMFDIFLIFYEMWDTLYHFLKIRKNS